MVLHGFFWVCMLGCMFLPCDHLYSLMLIHILLPVWNSWFIMFGFRVKDPCHRLCSSYAMVSHPQETCHSFATNMAIMLNDAAGLSLTTSKSTGTGLGSVGSWWFSEKLLVGWASRGHLNDTAGGIWLRIQMWRELLWFLALKDSLTLLFHPFSGRSRGSTWLMILHETLELLNFWF